jgi:anti-anti-sigma factor
VIDLLAGSFFGSAGLAALIEAQQRAGAHCQIRLVASGPVTIRPLQATGLAAVFVICASRTEALDPPPAPA